MPEIIAKKKKTIHTYWYHNFVLPNITIVINPHQAMSTKQQKLHLWWDAGVSDPSTAFKLRHLTSSCAPVIITTPTRGHRLTINTITIGRFHRLPMWEVWHICRSYIGRKETSPKKLSSLKNGRKPCQGSGLKSIWGVSMPTLMF